MKFITGIVTGIVVGSAISAVSVSNLDRKTRKKIGKSGKMVATLTNDIYHSMNNIKK